MNYAGILNVFAFVFCICVISHNFMCNFCAPSVLFLCIVCHLPGFMCKLRTNASGPAGAGGLLCTADHRRHPGPVGPYGTPGHAMRGGVGHTQALRACGRVPMSNPADRTSCKPRREEKRTWLISFGGWGLNAGSTTKALESVCTLRFLILVLYSSSFFP